MNCALQDPRGFITEDTICYYTARARGSFGMIVTEAVSTNGLCSQTLQYYNSKQYDPDYVFGWRREEIRDE
jgi:2,4-dienoyl-CoA reductase-like NADH-dependent reductase (Old Yellow Enzyme family)